MVKRNDHAFLIKTPISDPKTATFSFTAQKTMYGANGIAAGDVIYLFDSENEGGVGLFAKGVVTSAQPTPRVSITYPAGSNRPLRSNF